MSDQNQPPRNNPKPTQGHRRVSSLPIYVNNSHRPVSSQQVTQRSLRSTLDNAAYSTVVLLEYARERGPILNHVDEMMTGPGRERAHAVDETIHANVQELTQLLPGLQIAPQQQVRLFRSFCSLKPD